MNSNLPGKRVFFAMKLTVLFITVAFLQVSAKTFSQQLSISVKRASLENVMKEIQAQSGFNFLYEKSYLKNAKPVTIQVKAVSLEEALSKVFSGQPFTYSIENRIVVVKQKEKSIADKLIDYIKSLDIKGKVLDEKKVPLIGASVKIKNKKTAVVTDNQGVFLLHDVEPEDVILISYVGYTTTEVNAFAFQNGMLEISLVPDEGLLNEVIVNSGYQKISKERATGAYDIVPREQLNKPNSNIATRLIGAAAGVQAKLNANGDPTFEIRGQSSLYAAKEPLVVVDGFPVQGNFSAINPNDVESVTILKDAAAASIWGARAGNGVIVITTKNAKKGNPLQVNISAFAKIGGKLNLDYVNPLASSAETIEYEKQTFNRWGAAANPGVVQAYLLAWSPGTVAMNEQLLGFMTADQRDDLLAKYAGIDNKSQISDQLLANPSSQQYNLSLSGSSERMSHSLSVLYDRSQTNFKGSKADRYMLNYRTTANVFKWLDLHLSGFIQQNKSTTNGVQLSDIQNMAPYEMLLNEDGSKNNISQYYWPIMSRFVPMSKFPYADWTYNPINEINNRDLVGNQLNVRLQGGLTLKVLPGLTIDSKLQYENFNSTSKYVYSNQTFYVRNMVNQAASWNMATGVVTPNLPLGGILDQGRIRNQSYSFRNQLNYNKTFGEKHEFTFVAGTEMNNANVEVFANPLTYGYNDETLTVGNFPNGPTGTKDWMGRNQNFSYTNTFGYTTERFFSLYSNLAYTFNRKYTLSGSYRTDASNLITDDPKYRYAPLWSAGIVWQLSREDFFKDISWVNQLNVRATYGFNGNVDKSTAFMPLIAVSGAPNIYTNELIASISSYGNSTLRWEKTGTWNLGLDYVLFGNKLFGKVDLYNKRGKDLIAPFSIPAANGTISQKLNQAAMTNKGIELEIGSIQNIKDKAISWRGSLNFSYNHNKITDLYVVNNNTASLINGGAGAYVENYNANTLWTFQYGGIVNKQPTVIGMNGAKYDFSSFPTGDAKTFLVNSGTKVAPYTLGMINSFKLYDFDLSFIVTGKFGHKFQRNGFNYPSLFTGRTLPNNKLSEVRNADPEQMIPLPLNENEPNYLIWTRYAQNMSYLSANASHIRMQEVNLTYNLKQHLLSKLKIRNAALFIQGNDLFTITANKFGEDPEYPLGTINPQARVTFGFQLEL
jgi:TonB-linked SusC/RagA family outer membrane protein